MAELSAMSMSKVLAETMAVFTTGILVLTRLTWIVTVTRSRLEQMCNLLIRLSEHWPSYRVFDWQKDVLRTNNGTEQAIGCMQMRSRTVRGYKSWPGMWAGLMLSGSSMV